MHIPHTHTHTRCLVHGRCEQAWLAWRGRNVKIKELQDLDLFWRSLFNIIHVLSRSSLIFIANKIMATVHCLKLFHFLSHSQTKANSISQYFKSVCTENYCSTYSTITESYMEQIMSLLIQKMFNFRYNYSWNIKWCFMRSVFDHFEHLISTLLRKKSKNFAISLYSKQLAVFKQWRILLLHCDERKYFSYMSTHPCREW